MEKENKKSIVIKWLADRLLVILSIASLFAIGAVFWRIFRDLMKNVTPEAMVQMKVLVEMEGGAELISATYALIGASILLAAASVRLIQYFISEVISWREQKKHPSLGA